MYRLGLPIEPVDLTGYSGEVGEIEASLESRVDIRRAQFIPIRGIHLVQCLGEHPHRVISVLKTRE